MISWLKFLVALVAISIALTMIQLYVASHQNFALKLDGQIGDFDAATVVSDQSFTNTKTLISTPHCLLVPTLAGSLNCINGDTGSMRWQALLTDTLQSEPLLITSKEALLVSLHGGGLTLISEKTGDTLWEFKDIKEFNWKQTLVSADQKFVVLLNTRNQVFVFETATGKLLWQTPENETDPLELKTQIFLNGEQVFVADSAAFTLRSLNLKTGDQQWRLTTYSGDVNNHLEFAGGLVWYATNFYTWQGVDPATGVTKAKIIPPPGSVITALPNTLVFHNYSNQLTWFDAQTGSALGTTQLTGKIQKTWFEETLYIKLAEAPFVENLTAVNAETREKIWQSQSLQIIRNVEKLNNSTIVTTSLNGLVTWINSQTGETLAQTKTQENPLILLKKNQVSFWILTTHHGTYSTAPELIDAWFFEKPGQIKLHVADLSVIGATGLLHAEKLWLVNQSQNLVIGLTQAPWQRDVRYWLRSDFPVSSFTKIKNFFNKIALLKSLRQNQLYTTAAVTKNFQGCLITTTTVPINPQLTQVLHQVGFNPTQDATLSVTLKQNDSVITSVKGFYALPETWKAFLVAPNLATETNLNLEIKLKIVGSTLTEQFAVTIPANCTTNFITLSEDKKLLQTPDQKNFWGLGIQDSMLDSDHSGSVFDDWQFGEANTPDFSKPIPRHSFLTYLQNYRRAGYSIFRISQDNFSFKNWLSFQPHSFRTSQHTGLITDRFLQQLRSENYRIVFGLFGFQPETESTAVTRYLDYCIARFGAWIDIWEISNEAWPDASWVAFVSEYLKQHDPYHHPITTSWDRSNLPTIDVVNLHYYRSEPAAELTAEFLNQIATHESTNKPILFGEFGNSDTNWDATSPERLRIKTWLSAWQRTSLIIWNQSGTAAIQKQNANLYMGPNENEVTKKLVSWLGKYEDIALEPFALKTTSGNFCSGLTNATSLLLIYCTNSSGTAKTEIFDPTIVMAAAGITTINTTWKVNWFDPATLVQKGTFKVSVPSAESIAAPAFTSDIVSEWQLAQ